MANDSIDRHEMKLMGRALRMLRTRAALTMDRAGERFGVGSGEAWRKYESGSSPGIFSPETQSRLAAAVNATRQDLLDERARLAGDDVPSRARISPGERQAWTASREHELVLLPVRDTIQAGAWLMADDVDQDQPPTYPAARDPRFPQAGQWLSEVRGDSMNQLNIVEGDLVHCVDAAGIGYYPRSGDVLEVERLRFGGQERELTLKQVEVTHDAVLLWPRSTNPRWHAPLEMREGTSPGEDVEVRIRALVVATIRRF